MIESTYFNQEIREVNTFSTWKKFIKSNKAYDVISAGKSSYSEMQTVSGKCAINEYTFLERHSLVFSEFYDS